MVFPFVLKYLTSFRLVAADEENVVTTSITNTIHFLLGQLIIPVALVLPHRGHSNIFRMSVNHESCEQRNITFIYRFTEVNLTILLFERI